MKSRSLAVSLLLCLVAGGVQAALTNSWPFTTPSQYMLSDSNRVEVADGVAKLKLQYTHLCDASNFDYLTNNTQLARLILGRDSSVGLTKTGLLYQDSGTYVSRVIDGGVGNTWQALASRVSNRVTSPPYIGGTTVDPSLIALYRFNGTWVDEVTGQTGTPVNVIFTNQAQFGQAASVSLAAGSGFKTANQALLNGKSEFTMTFWARIRTANNGGMVVDNSYNATGAYIGFLSSGGKVRFALTPTDTIISPSIFPVDTWFHVAGVFKNGTRMELYINGVLVANKTPGSYNAFQGSNIYVGLDYNNTQTQGGIYDEVAAYNRALSAAEINALYNRRASIGIRVRSGPDAVLTNSFVGSDGTTSGYFIQDAEPLTSLGSFQVSDRYVQYEATLLSPNGTVSPMLQAVSFLGTAGIFGDDARGDFLRGSFVQNTTNIPQASDTPFIALALGNEGVVTNGTYTSRVIDGGGSVNWNQLAWDRGTELSSALSGIIGLWHFNGTLGDSMASHNGAANGGLSYTFYSKLGSDSLVFNGADASVDLGNFSTTIQSAEFWFNPALETDAILEFGASSPWLAVSNQFITVNGAGAASPTIFVNNRPSRQLLPGWNHVAIVFPSAITADAVKLGVARGDYYAGKLDELAFFSRALTSADVAEHYVMGRRDAAGRIRFQARADNVNPPQTSFVGSDGTASTYLLNPGGSGLPLTLSGKQYFQYKAFLDGDGTESPALSSVTVRYGSGLSITDRSKEEFNQGSYDGARTRIHGDEMSLIPLFSAHAVNLDAASSPQLIGLWHMDDVTWTAGSPDAVDSSGNNRNGTPYGGALNLDGGVVGSRYGDFSANGYLAVQDFFLNANDFSASAWFKTSSGSRAAILSSYHGSGLPYYALEVNGDGSGVRPGIVTFVISDGTTMVAVLGALAGLNDGVWHHVSGVRNGQQVLLYIDGILSGSSSLGSGVFDLGGAPLNIAKYGSQSIYFTGGIDEVAMHGRALTEKEIGDMAAMGFATRYRGEFTGKIFDLGQDVYWEKLYWGCDAPYGRALKADGSTVGLWHCDAISNNATADASGSGNDGLVSGGIGVAAGGRFENALMFVLGNQVTVNDSPLLRVASFSAEAWILPNNTNNIVIMQKSSASPGFTLGVDTLGRAYLKVNGVTTTDPDVLRSRKWTHVCGTHDGQTARLYVNGLLEGVIPVSGSAQNSSSVVMGSGLDGYMDEAALYSRVLNAREVFDHYRAGIAKLGFQVRSAPPADFVGPDGTTNTFFVDFDGSTVSSVVPINPYFQYKAYFETEDARISPKLDSVRVDSSGYPTDNPWVAPAAGFDFPGNLVSFSHLLATTNAAAVQYQISGNNGSNWYAHIGGEWQDVTAYTNPATQWAMSNTRSVINDNITSFYSTLYQGVGGKFKFRAFLKSDAIQQVALDQVDLGYSTGRLLLTSPNGTEVSNNAWVVGVPYDITWLSSGSVTATNIVIELYDQSGTHFIKTLAGGVANSGVYRTVIHTDQGTTFRIRIRDGSDPTIFDWSDGDFELKYDLHLSIPNGGEKWYVGETNGVSWESPLGTEMSLWLSNDDGSNNWVEVTRAPSIIGTNGFLWAIQTHEPMLPSMTAKMAVSTPDVATPRLAPFYDLSDNSFVMAGAVVTYPNAATGLKMGDTTNILWTSAAAGPAVKIELFDGAAWTNLTASTTNMDGANSFTCALNAPNPTEEALIRITSLSDGRIIATSYPFLLADIRILSPKGGSPLTRDNLQIGTTNYVSWVSGGAGDLVNVDYSVDGTNWTSIAANYVNTNSSGGVVVTNFAPAWIIQGPPSSSAVVRVSSVARPDLQAKTDYFNLAGVQVAAPNGGEYWEFTGTNVIRWLNQGAGFNIGISITYNGGATTNDYITLDPSLSIFSGLRTVVPGRLLRPSTLAKVKITANDTIGNPIPMVDISDGYFFIRGLSAIYPQTNAVYTMGTVVADGLQWYSAATEDPTADLYYAPDGSNFTAQIVANTANIDAGSSWNHISWSVPRNLIPSKTARIKVVAGSYQGVSPVFTLRGIRITQPTAGQVFDLGSKQFVYWTAAGLQDSAYVSNVVSVAGQGGDYVAGGLPANAYVRNGALTWNIDPDLDPTTNAVIKMIVTTPTNDTDLIMYSDPFVLRGAKILSPYTGTNWMIGTSQTIVYAAAGLTAGAVGNIYYSADGGSTFDMANPVAINVPMASGINSVTWNIENSSALTRQPSTNAVLKLISGTVTNLSKPFRMGGIKVTAPRATDIWAVSDLTNTVQWVGIDTLPSFNIFYTVYDAPQHSGTIATGVPGFAYNWAMTSNAIGSQVTVSVTDGVTTNESPSFVIVPAPSIRLISPAAGEFWKVGETNNTIRWVKGGNMSNDFTVGYSPYPFTVTNTIATGAFPFDDGIYSFTWGPIPNSLGQIRLVVVNNQLANIFDSQDNFRIAPTFQIQPFVGELHAMEPKDVNWMTLGSVAGVDFYYSTDPFRATNSWTLVNTAAPFTSVGHLVSSTYIWNVPNIKSSTVWFRIQDHAYAGQMFDASRKGPYDDLGTFEILYYSVVWRLFDAATSNEFTEANMVDGSRLSVADSSGWSASGLTSPVAHDYPYGYWNTVWYKQYFNDKIILNWSSKVASTNYVYLNRTEASPEYHVMANFAYDPTNSVFKTVAWLERSSQIIPDPTECIIYVYDPEGNEVQQVNAGAPRSTGVFWGDVGGLLDKNRPYFAKVEIRYSGVMYTSGITFTLLSPSESAVAAVNAARDAILGSVSNVNDNVTGVGLAVGSLRTDLTNRMTSLSNTTAQISLDTTGIRSNLMNFSSNALAQLGVLTNTIGVIGPSGTNLIDQVAALTAEVDKRTARILTRPSTIKLGSTLTVLYRTKPLAGASISVTDSNGAVRVSSTLMTELSGGVFEKSVVASWGLGDFTVTCSDDTGASDQMIVRVSAYELDDMAGSLVNVSNQLALVEAQIFTMSTSVSNVQTTVNGTATNVTSLLTNVVNMQGMLAGLTNMPGQMSYLTNVIDKVAGLTNINSAVTALTNAVGQILAVTNMSSQISQLGALTNLTPQMTTLSNSMVRLMTITNQMNTLSAQMNYVTNVIDQIVVLTNINPAVTAMTNAVAQISGLTNMAGQLSYMSNAISQVSVLTNLTPQMTSLTNSMAKLSGITNQITTMSAQMNYMTNVIQQVSALTNINPAVSAMTNAIAQVMVLTNMGSQLSYVTNVVGQLSGLTNLAPQMTSLTNSMAKLITITNQMNTLSAQMNYVTNVIDQVVVLTNINPAVTAMTNAVAQISGLTNMGSQLNYLTNAMVQVQGLTNLTPQMASVTNLLGRMASLTNLTPQVASLTNMPVLLSSLTNMPTQVAGLSNVMTQVAGLTNLPSQMADVTNIVGKLTGITNLSDQVAVMTNAIAQIAGMTNLPSQMADVTNIVGRLAGITNLSDQVAVMTNAIAQISGLTNMGSRLDYLTNVVGQVAGLTNMGSQLDYLTNAVSQINGLTNLSTQMADVTNTVGQLRGLTNLPSQIAGLATSVGELGTMTNQMNGVVTAINQLGSLTNLGSQVDEMLLALGQVAGLTNIATTVNDLSTAMDSLIGITNVESQVGMLTGAVSSVATAVNTLGTQLGSLTNLGSQVDALGTTIAQISSLTNMSSQVNGLVDSVAQLGSVTNLGSQLAQVASTVDTIVTLTNLNTRMDQVTAAVNQLGSLTNLGATADQLTASISQITSLTNMSSQVAGLVTGVSGLDTTTKAISNAVESLSAASNPTVTSNTVTALAALTELTPAVASVSATVSNLQSSINPMQASLEALTGGLGAASDAAGTETLFGNIRTLEQNLTEVGTSAQQAMSRAGGARSQANSAAGAAARIKQAVAAGQIPQVMSDLAIIRKSLEEALTQVKSVSGGMSTDEMVKTVNAAADSIKKLAGERGVEMLGETAKAQPGSMNDPKTVAELMNKISETKAMMEATRQLMEEAVNKPVVVDWMEGTK